MHRYAEDFITDFEFRHAAPDGADHAGEIPPRDVRKLFGGGVVARAGFPVGAVDAGGVDVHHDLALMGHRIGLLAVLQDFGASVLHEKDSLHFFIVPCRMHCDDNGPPVR